ncbi:WavE lipopolysaccharide synthesis family protein [Hufsiella ginkgonis]|uniref:Uncharacterized protein n=1 Tax=Hufsiella ginkgonis TaxID=2695274 RepID=A0A7K1Y2G6_9SPHI|nr:WavE lipopolysaccharide synthesis family protein [Hufsiella ginkgonis]MXV17465.1 hypothetical protein [Hufsiella ginkgonis]
MGFLHRMFDHLVRSPRVNKKVLLERLVTLNGQAEGNFYTLNTRPVTTGDIYVGKSGLTGRQAIVMQGPLLLHDDFTYQTLALYARQISPGLVILSTWTTEDAATLNRVRALGVTVIVSEPPAYNGNQNINYQVVSTLAGMTHARDAGADHVLKTRTDQRIYSTPVLRLFNDMLEAFPAAGPQKYGRLVITSLGTIKYRLYGAGDMIMFGAIADMLNYWTIAPDTRVLKLKDANAYSIAEFSKLRLGELYYCSHYFEKMGHTLDWTLRQSWELMAKYFCVIDHSQLDVYWPKYDLRTEFRFKYYQVHSLQQMTFADWLSLYLNKVTDFPEAYLESAFGEKIPGVL